jgi:hypothetical protein
MPITKAEGGDSGSFRAFTFRVFVIGFCRSGFFAARVETLSAAGDGLR